ncbi:immunoglobulin superfamily member 5 [Myripristis murdjan]|uniref:immunoglobulin superfamily member 5 n=1 Tax=Myripristis murdjan TaxID=586833 RepID=UPI001175D8D6|nr:immunoglobulin superfamily member 5 [Myripristis murdjan]
MCSTGLQERAWGEKEGKAGEGALGVSGQLQLEPLNATVLQGEDVQFNASFKGDWQVMIWTVQGVLVLTVISTGEIYPYDTARFSARNYSSGDTSFVEFTIHNVNRSTSGSVVCTIQGSNQHRTAQLSVQESGTVDILSGNVTAVQDQEVEFQCAATAWFPKPTVSWTRNGEVVNSTLYSTNTTEARGGWFNTTSVLRFQAVSNTTVACLVMIPALQKPQSSSAHLVVVPKPPDWTVLIAVVVSIGGFALLVLLILGIIFCCKRRKEKESNYQDDLRRVRTQSQVSGVSPVGPRQGQINVGYVTDGQTSVPASEFNDSGFSQTQHSDRFELPDVLSSNQATNSHTGAYNTLDGSGFRKHRHVTIV